MRIALTTLILLTLIAGCADTKPKTIREEAIQYQKEMQAEFPHTSISVDDIERQLTQKPEDLGYTVEAEGWYLVHCRDGVVWKSKMKRANTYIDLVWITDGVIHMETLEGKRLMIPLANVHHIEFEYEMVKKEE